jgi:shikimate dehydrogenase
MSRVVALIGTPLRRRHSAVMHNAAFEAHDIDARFVLRELAAEEVPAFVEEARGDRWLGFGVTAPYKQLVMDLLDDVEPAAEVIGAVNNVVREPDGRLVGFNTDGIGFATAVREELDLDLRGARVVLAGAGGAAHAVAHACVERGAARLTIANRSGHAAQQLAKRLEAITDSDNATVTATETTGPAVDAALAEADLLVNATTVGATSAGMAIPPHLLPDDAAVFDLVYSPPETELLARSRARGLRAANGAAMLVAQAVAAFERWTGIADTGAVMRRAVTPLLEDPAAGA